MDTITVKVRDLHLKVRELYNRHMDYVTITILDGGITGEDAYPPALHFEARTANEPYLGLDFEEIEEVSIDVFDSSSVTMGTNILD